MQFYFIRAVKLIKEQSAIICDMMLQRCQNSITNCTRFSFEWPLSPYVVLSFHTFVYEVLLPNFRIMCDKLVEFNNFFFILIKIKLLKWNGKKPFFVSFTQEGRVPNKSNVCIFRINVVSPVSFLHAASQSQIKNVHFSKGHKVYKVGTKITSAKLNSNLAN